MANDGLGNSFTYDAENRLIKVVNGAGTTNYVYDADGRRVENGAYEFLYDLAGRAVTQFQTSNGVPSHFMIYAGNRHLATYSAGVTSFMHADWLGTKRVMTTLAGTPAVTCIGLPFGDGRNCTGNDRDFNEFTDDIDDSESGTEHTWFRQLSTTQGRWFGADPYLGSMNLADPQSLNRYAYVANNPTNAVDPTGLKIIIHQDWFISAMQVFDPFCGEDDITSLDPCGFGQGNPFGNTVDSLVFGGFDGSGGLPLGGCFLPGSCPLPLGWPSLGDLLPHPPCNPLSPMLDGCGFGNDFETLNGKCDPSNEGKFGPCKQGSWDFPHVNWSDFFQKLACWAGVDPDNMGPIKINPEPKDTTDIPETGTPAGQKGFPGQHIPRNNVPEEVNDRVGYLANVIQCIHNVNELHHN